MCNFVQKFSSVFNFNFHPGQQKWNQIRRANWSPDREQVCRLFFLVLMWVCDYKKLSSPTLCVYLQLWSLQILQQSWMWVRMVRSWTEVDILNVIRTRLVHTNTFFWLSHHLGQDPIEQLLKLEANKVNTVKKVWKRMMGMLRLFKCRCSHLQREKICRVKAQTGKPAVVCWSFSLQFRNQ